MHALDPSARTLAAGEFEAVFLPGRGMLGASLRHRGDELLGCVDDLEHAAKAGSAAGIPLLHPWANRLSGLEYEAADELLRRARWNVKAAIVMQKTGLSYTRALVRLRKAHNFVRDAIGEDAEPRLRELLRVG